MTHSVIHYWCLPQPGWWIIKPLIRPGNSASSSADDTHLHKSHAAIFHTHSHINTNIHPRTVTHTKFMDFGSLCDVHGPHLFSKRFQKHTFLSYLEEKLIGAVNTEVRLRLLPLTSSAPQLQHLHAHRWKPICSTSSGPHIVICSSPLDDRYVLHM